MKTASITAAAERFARDTGPHKGTMARKGMRARPRTRGHEMTVLLDQGLYRHLRYKSPDRSSYWFDLITWPGCLTIRGDLNAAYTFAGGGHDMFGFFRGRSIDPQYWTQKLDADQGSTTTYDQDLCEQIVKEHVVEAIRDGRAPRGIGRAVTELLREGDFAWEDGAYAELTRFEYGAKVALSCECLAATKFDADSVIEVMAWRQRHRGPGHFVTEEHVEGFRFHDVYEWRFRDFDWSFLWACHAIVWGIEQYDQARTAVAA